MTKKITSNSTKNEILEAYHGLVEQLKAAEFEKLDPAKEVATKKATETLTRAESTASQSIEDKIANLQKTIAGILGNLSNSFTEEIKTFQNLQEAIALKEAELKELFDIEREAFSLAALVNSRKEIAAKYDEEMEQRRLAAAAQLDQINVEIRESRIKFQAEIAEEKKKLEVERQREREEYNYNFARQKQRELDKLNDDINDLRKEFDEKANETQIELNERSKELDEREGAVAVREERLDDLESQVRSFPEREARIRAEVEETVRKDEARSRAITENSIKKHYESEKLVLDNQIKLLNESLENERAKNAMLTDKLDAAYDKIQGMALASVQGSNEFKALDKLTGLLDKNQK